MKKTFGKSAYSFLTNLKPDFTLPENFEFILPYASPEVKKVTSDFYNKFYCDSEDRIFIIGINPGRLGAGKTGISFNIIFR